MVGPQIVTEAVIVHLSLAELIVDRGYAIMVVRLTDLKIANVPMGLHHGIAVKLSVRMVCSLIQRLHVFVH